MKKILFIVILLPVISLSQNLNKIQSQIDSIETINNQYQQNIYNNKILITNLKKELLKIKANQEEISTFYYKVGDSIKIYEEQSDNSKVLCWAHKNDSLKILNFNSGFFIVKFKDFFGYIYHYSLPLSPELNHLREFALLKQFNCETNPQKKIYIQNQIDLLNTLIRRTAVEAENLKRVNSVIQRNEVALENEIKKNQEALRKEKIIQDKKLAENNKLRKEKIYKKYNQSIAAKIVERKIWIGMTSEMAVDSWGSPKDINRTVTQYGTSEQWVYSSGYLYFDNGILKSWQD